MKKSELYSLMGAHLDLAVEAHDLLRGEAGGEIPGVKMEEETHDIANIKIVTVLDEQGASMMGRPQGTYLTMESKALREGNKEIHKQISILLAEKLEEILSLNDNSTILVVGLGNWNATPDALGPKVIDYTPATRHLFQFGPVELQQGYRSVCIISPGVLGLTGIETVEIIKGTVDHVKPDVVICIDALAAGNVERINSTIQIATTGINPGSGVGNKRKAINQQTLGVPVIAIGVPTVVHAGIIAHQAIEELANSRNMPMLQNALQSMHPFEINDLISKVLAPFGGQLMVTPKEIDEQITNTAYIIAMALTIALHPGVPPEEVELYLH
ncbi:MAG: GPR endopeptidase [Peptococcia bacterium]